MVKSIKKILKRLVIALMLSASLLGNIGMTAYASDWGIEPFKIRQETITYEENLPNVEDIIKIDKVESKGRILIYHSHSQEEYKDWDVIKAGNELTKQLESYGYTVTHLKDDFSGKNGYGKSYKSSREVVSKISKDYDVVLDLHRNSESPITKNNIAKGMFVYASDTNTYKDNKVLGDGIKKYIDEDLLIKDVEYTNVRSNVSFNQDLKSDIGVILFELGGVDNTKDQVKPLISALSEGLNTYLKEILK